MICDAFKNECCRPLIVLLAVYARCITQAESYSTEPSTTALTTASADEKPPWCYRDHQHHVTMTKKNKNKIHPCIHPIAFLTHRNSCFRSASFPRCLHLFMPCSVKHASLPSNHSNKHNLPRSFFIHATCYLTPCMMM